MTDIREPLNLNELIAQAKQSKLNELAAQATRTVRLIGQAGLELTEIDAMLEGDKREEFAAAVAALLVMARATGDPAAFMARAVASANDAPQAQATSAPHANPSVTSELDEEIALLNRNRDNRRGEVGGVLKIIRAIIRQTFSEDANQAGLPKEWQLFFDPKSGEQTLGIVYVLARQNNKLWEVTRKMRAQLPKLIRMVGVRVEHPSATEPDGKIFVFEPAPRAKALRELNQLQHEIGTLADPSADQTRTLGSAADPNGAGNGNDSN